LLLGALFAALSACSTDQVALTGVLPDTNPDPLPSVLLKDVIIPLLPSPYYHFEYGSTGRISSASFASNFTMYDLSYTQGRLSEMQNNILVNHDRLVYNYDNAGHVREIDYTKPGGVVFTRVRFSYSGTKLTGVERQRMIASGFIVDKTMTLAYDVDGNLSDLTERRPMIAGVQNQATYTDHFEDYDTGVNVDGFGLLHQEFFDHLILLPRVQLQKSNPRRVTHGGDSDHYVIDYTYQYDSLNRPRTKTGVVTFTSGARAGQQFPDGATFTYY